MNSLGSPFVDFDYPAGTVGGTVELCFRLAMFVDPVFGVDAWGPLKAAVRRTQAEQRTSQEGPGGRRICSGNEGVANWGLRAECIRNTNMRYRKGEGVWQGLTHTGIVFSLRRGKVNAE